MKPNPQVNPASSLENAEHRRFVEKLLRSRRKAEALRWLSVSESTRRRALGEFRGAKPSAKLVEELYAAGATKVMAVDIKTNPTGSQRTEKVLVVLPTETKARARIFKWCKRRGGKIGYSPECDMGETHLYLLLA